jgi:hypothetical protein
MMDDIKLFFLGSLHSHWPIFKEHFWFTTFPMVVQGTAIGNTMNQKGSNLPGATP